LFLAQWGGIGVKVFASAVTQIGLTNQTGAFCYSHACSEDVFKLQTRDSYRFILNLMDVFIYGWCSLAG